MKIEWSKNEVISIRDKIAKHWKEYFQHLVNAFWQVSAYYKGDIEAYKVTKNEDYLIFFALVE